MTSCLPLLPTLELSLPLLTSIFSSSCSISYFIKLCRLNKLYHLFIWSLLVKSIIYLLKSLYKRFCFVKTFLCMHFCKKREAWTNNFLYFYANLLVIAFQSFYACHCMAAKNCQYFKWHFLIASKNFIQVILLLYLSGLNMMEGI